MATNSNFVVDFSAIDPCQEKKGGCQHHCVNENGRARCQCFAGYRLAYDRKTCVGKDIFIFMEKFRI